MEEYKVRFIKEYEELRDKHTKLEIMLNKWEVNELNFTPSCSYELLNAQKHIMASYLAILQERAYIEKIQL